MTEAEMRETTNAGWKAWNECRQREEKFIALLVDLAAFISCRCAKCAHLAPSVDVLLPRIGVLIGSDPPLRFLGVLEAYAAIMKTREVLP